MSSLSNWTATKRPLLDPNLPFDLSSHAYLRGIYDPQIESSEQGRRFALMKSGQSGGTEWAMSRAFWTCDVLHENVFWVMPTGAAVSDLSQSRFTPAVEASEYLRGLVGRGDGRYGTDRVKLKSVGGNYIALRSGHIAKDGSSPELKSFVAGLVIRDELNEMDKQVIPLSQRRLGHSILKHEIDISTPTYPGVGIDLVWKESDQREWAVPCPHCGRLSLITIDQVILERDDAGRPISWRGMNEGRAWIACMRCGRELNRLAEGEWVARYPGRPIIAWHISKLFTMHNTVLSVVRSLQKTDEGEYREAVNQDLGLSYMPPGGNLTDDDLDHCIEAASPAYSLVNQSRVPTYMGVDIGENIHYAVIRGRQDNETGQRPLRFASELTSFDAIGRLIRDFKVKVCVIDIRPQVDAVRNIQSAFPDRVWLCEYKTDTTWPEPLQWIEDKDSDKDGLVFADRSRTLDTTRGRFLGEYPENTLPASIKVSARDYYPHLKALSRHVIDKPGTPGVKVVRYLGEDADHFFHAENYCSIASLGQPRRRHGLTTYSTKAKGWAPLAGTGSKVRM